MRPLLEKFKRALSSLVDELLGIKAPSVTGLIRGGVLLSVGFGFVIACFEPESTANLGFVANVTIWTTLFFVGALLLVVLTVIGTIAGLKASGAVICAVLVLPFLILPLSLAIEFLTDPISLAGLKPTQFWQLAFEELLEVTPISLALCTLFAVVAVRTGELTRTLRAQMLASDKPEPRIQQLLPQIPERLGSDLLRAEAQDHYVLFVLTEGSVMVKMPFKEALKRLKSLRGVHCHRSHWVRLRHIESVAASGSAFSCTLTNGDAVPVSRRRHSALKAPKVLL